MTAQVDVTPHIDLDDLQGNILRGYRMAAVRHLVVQVHDARAARQFLASTLDGRPGGPAITTATYRAEPPRTCLNVSFSATGLRALGLGAASLATFPAEFIDGAVGRAAKIGDVGRSAPQHWVQGMSNPHVVHVMWTLYGASSAEVAALSAQVEDSWRRTGAFSVTARFDGAQLPDGKVHFGYRDSISQPRLIVDGEAIGRRNGQPNSPLGVVLLGHDSSYAGVRFNVPQPTAIGLNGTFNAFRVLEQDVDAFESFLLTAADAHPSLTVELVAAKLMGRWRNGVPLTQSPDEQVPIDADTERVLNDFDYVSVEHDDFDGVSCPVGSHIRRTNPRMARIAQRSSNHTRQLVRRGMPYGAAYDPQRPHDGVNRGLLGNFMCGSLIAQFEAIMYDWVNLGLQDPRITGTNDPIVGANCPATSRFEIAMPDGQPPIVLTGFPRFTETVAGAYFFVPSITGLRAIAALTGHR